MTRAIKDHWRDFVALILIFVISIGVTGFIIWNQESRPTIPFVEDKPKVLYLEFSDAQAVVPGQGQSVRVAGVQVGKIREVRLHHRAEPQQPPVARHRQVQRQRPGGLDLGKDQLHHRAGRPLRVIVERQLGRPDDQLAQQGTDREDHALGW